MVVVPPRLLYFTRNVSRSADAEYGVLLPHGRPCGLGIVLGVGVQQKWFVVIGVRQCGCRSELLFELSERIFAIFIPDVLAIVRRKMVKWKRYLREVSDDTSVIDVKSKKSLEFLFVGRSWEFLHSSDRSIGSSNTQVADSMAKSR